MYFLHGLSFVNIVTTSNI